MEEYYNFKFDKPWVLQKELLKLMSMSESTLKRYMADWRKEGKLLAEMGYLKFQGFREAVWQPTVFVSWIVQNKLAEEPEYDYELAEQKRTEMNIINLAKQQKKKEAYNG